MRFRDRADAGRQLAAVLGTRSLIDPVVLALPRGGVPVGYEIACALDAPLDVIVSRKVGAPGHREFGIGAVAEGGVVVVDDDTLVWNGITRATFDRLAERERAELERRVVASRAGRPRPSVVGRDVVVVDDGLATGVTAHAAALALRHSGAGSSEAGGLILAVPTAAPDSADRLTAVFDEVVSVIRPRDFAAVGHWYEDFSETTDAEVHRLLARAASRSTTQG